MWSRMACMMELSGAPAVRKPKWGAANLKTCPRTQKPAMAFPHNPVHVSGVQPIYGRLRIDHPSGPGKGAGLVNRSPPRHPESGAMW